jgi:DNA primase
LQDLEFRQLVERLKLRAPIEAIVAERVEGLRKKGALHWARCPFHEERTPSFAVDPRRGTWRCFGACAEGGDVIAFLERFDGLSFMDALRLLAQITGEELPENLFRGRSRAGGEREEDHYDVLRRAKELYRRHLLGSEGEAARAYAAERGLSEATLETFGVGLAPAEGNPVLDAATRAGVDRELLIETGLVRRSEEGRSYDFFRGRLMVPIHDRLGRTVGFGARLLGTSGPARPDDRPQPKYVNTPETPLFHKGRLIYGLDLAAKAVRASRRLVLVEGYTDVMAAHQVGCANVAAVLGTATTEDHAALVRRSGAERVTLVFDGDAAGEKASERALAGLLPLGIDLRVATLPNGVDPCDLLLGEDGAARFDALLEEARDWFAWALEDLRSLQGAALGRGVDELFRIVARLSRPVERSARVKEIAEALGLPLDDVRLQWRRFEEGQRRPVATPRQPEPEAAPARAVDPAVEHAFEDLLGALLLDNSLIPVHAGWIEECPEGDLRTIFRAVLDLYEDEHDEESIHTGRVLTVLGDHPARTRAALLEERARTAESPAVLARDQTGWLERRHHEGELAALRSELARTTQTFEGDDAAKAKVLENLHEQLRRQRVPVAETSSSVKH